MEIGKIFEFLIPEKKSTLNKLLLVVIIMAGLYLVNDLLGFTYFYRTDRKITLIRELNLIINDTTLDNSTRTSILEMRKDVIRQSPVINGFPNSVFQTNPGIMSWLFYLTASVINIIIILFGFLSVFMQKNDEDKMGLKTYFSLSVYYIGPALLTVLICLIIPKIPLWGYVFTYISNFIIQVIIILVMLAYTTSNSK